MKLLSIYLAAYNFVQFLLWLLIFSTLVVGSYHNSSNALYMAWDVSLIVKFAQIVGLLEIIHSVAGFTKGGVVPTLIQSAGRNSLLFAILNNIPQLHTSSAMYLLFLCWSTIEIVRYPFYIYQILNSSFYPLVWLRYTLWIPLYPLGVFAELALLYESLQYIVAPYHYIVMVWMASYFFVFPQQLMYMASQRSKNLSAKDKTK
eukprot:TRINITY_DN7262_c0_g1_i1.p1 TRINITY_DN7262_c0_g1~~TRINITY_DN7262_c0_g1_i1.p1  ORF type:complete len:203 (+),score=2.64 TRINITY_DN7262_c0_g1_i1:2-610(+)